MADYNRLQRANELVASAQTAFANNRTGDALKDVKAAFLEAMWAAEAVIGFPDSKFTRAVPSQVMREVKNAVDALDKYINAITDRLTILSLGIDPVDHAKFLSNTPNVSITAAGTYFATFWGPAEIEANKFEWMTEFVKQVISKVENIVARAQS